MNSILCTLKKEEAWNLVYIYQVICNIRHTCQHDSLFKKIKQDMNSHDNMSKKVCELRDSILGNLHIFHVSKKRLKVKMEKGKCSSRK